MLNTSISTKNDLITAFLKILLILQQYLQTYTPNLISKQKAQVHNLSTIFVVAGTGFEPATSGL